MSYLNILLYITAAGSGVILGLIYFLGLWLTVTKVSRVRHPYLLMVGSFLVRTLLVLFGFYLLLIYNWTYLILAMVTFLITRHWVIRHKKGSTDYIYG